MTWQPCQARGWGRCATRKVSWGPTPDTEVIATRGSERSGSRRYALQRRQLLYRALGTSPKQSTRSADLGGTSPIGTQFAAAYLTDAYLSEWALLRQMAKGGLVDANPLLNW